MNTGVISARYAKALLAYVRETGNGGRVCAQVRSMLESPESVAAMTLEPEISRLVALLAKNGRMGDLKLVLRSFVEQYYQSEGIMLARLKTAVPAPGLDSRLKPVVERQFGSKVIMETEVDPAIQGGFILEVGNYQLDASVRRQIERIRREFVIQNNRLV